MAQFKKIFALLAALSVILQNVSGTSYAQRDTLRAMSIAVSAQEAKPFFGDKIHAKTEALAEEVFRCIDAQKHEIKIAESIDKLGINSNDNVLCVGVGTAMPYPVACAIRGASVDVVQPEGMLMLKEFISRAQERIIREYGNDLTGNRINTDAYQGKVEDQDLPAKHYTHVILPGVLDYIQFHGYDYVKLVVGKILSSCKDEVTILASVMTGSLEDAMAPLRAEAKVAGYNIVTGRSFFTDELSDIQEFILSRADTLSPKSRAVVSVINASLGDPPDVSKPKHDTVPNLGTTLSPVVLSVIEAGA